MREGRSRKAIWRGRPWRGPLRGGCYGSSTGWPSCGGRVSVVALHQAEVGGEVRSTRDIRSEDGRPDRSVCGEVPADSAHDRECCWLLADCPYDAGCGELIGREQIVRRKPADDPLP